MIDRDMMYREWLRGLIEAGGEDAEAARGELEELEGKSKGKSSKLDILKELKSIGPEG